MDLEIFDIETGALSPEDILMWTRPFPEFEESSVKVGNLKDAEKIREKLVLERQKHAEEKDAYYSKALEKAALDPKTGYVVAIGLMNSDGETEILSGAEADLLEEFWSMARFSLGHQRKLAGWNIEMFDLPFLLRRSWRLGVNVPVDVYLGRGRWNTGFIDLMRVWTFGEYKEFEKLDTVARFLGFEGKCVEGASGANFSKLWNGSIEEKTTAIEYLKNDVLQTRLVAERLLNITRFPEKEISIFHLKNQMKTKEIQSPFKELNTFEFKIWALYTATYFTELKSKTLDVTDSKSMIEAVASDLDEKEEAVAKGLEAVIKKGFLNVKNI